jgi:hypothetical protein
VAIDEDPSPQDLARFEDDTAFCPECGERVWDDCPSCPACGSWIEGQTIARPPLERQIRGRLLVLVALAALAALLVALLLL